MYDLGLGPRALQISTYLGREQSTLEKKPRPAWPIKNLAGLPADIKF